MEIARDIVDETRQDRPSNGFRAKRPRGYADKRADGDGREDRDVQVGLMREPGIYPRRCRSRA